MVKVLHIANTQFFLERLLQGKLKGLASAGHEIHVAAPYESASFLPYPFYDIPIPRTMKIFECLRAVRKLEKLLDAKRFDLIHTHSSIGGMIGRYAAHRKGIKCIHTVHGLPFYEGQNKAQYLLYYTLEKYAARLCDAILFQNHEEMELCDSLGFDSPLFYEGNGINIEALQAQAAYTRASFGLSDTDFVLGFFARIEPVKGHLFFIEAFEKLYKRLPCAHVLLGGANLGRSTDYTSRVNDVLSSSPAKSQFHVLGFREDVPCILPLCDALVLPSQKEGIPRIAMEAMALGVPVIATKVQGTRELIENESSGLLVPYGDVPALTEAMQRVACDNALRHTLIECGKARIASAFDEREVIKRILVAYDGVFKGS